MVLIVLIVLWSIVLIPPAWQSHAEARRARQADAFRRRLAVLAPAPDTPLARPPLDAAPALPAAARPSDGRRPALRGGPGARGRDGPPQRRAAAGGRSRSRGRGVRHRR